MKRNAEKTRRLLRHLARRIVRGYAVAALVAGGFLGAAAQLEGGFDDDDDGEAGVSRLRQAVHRATTTVLATPHSPESERALIALLAARKAVAVAGVAEPTEAHVQDILVSAAVAADPDSA
jgi:hypothetical protein